MAETNSQQQNQAFLQQLERQRLAKPCRRLIDLRGKVAGECHVYQIGQQTHYLDDRSYLLLKTLLERSDNLFTVGVFEAWQKAHQLLMQQDNVAVADPTQKPILYRDSRQFQWLDFDQRIERREPRLNFTTPALIDAQELRYHASTINISASAMRLSMRRAQHLQTGQQVFISLPDLQAEAPADLLTEMPYVVQSLAHSERQTIAVVQRQSVNNLSLSQWFDNWLAARQQLSRLDLDSELFNLAHEYYLRLFCRHFSTALFWCDAAYRVLFVHSSDAADKMLAPLQQHDLTDRLPFAALAGSAKLLVSITADGQLSWAETPLQKKALLQQKDLQHLYLLHAEAIDIAADNIDKELLPLAQRHAETAAHLSAQIQQCQQLVTLTDITASCSAISTAAGESAASPSPLLPALELPPAQRLRLYIARSAERFEIHTPVVLHHHDQRLNLTTNELSSGGLSVKLPVEQKISVGSRVTVDFVRWQQQSKLKLTGIPYEVRSQQCWQGTQLLGLRRLTENCATPVNQFFEQVLNDNKPTLAVRNDDLQLSLSSRLFAKQLSLQLADVLLFFALDADNNRILQAVAATEKNTARQQTALWQAIGSLAGRLTLPLKLPLSELQGSVSFGIYAFRRDATADWQVSSDLGFEDATSKQLFIRRALAASEQRFFQCHLQPLKAEDLTTTADLQQQLMQLNRHNRHKVKQIRETLSSLFAIGQLTDITDLVTSQYR